MWPGIALTLIVLAAAELPGIVTRFGLRMAASTDAATSRRGDAWLRSLGDRNSMLRNCYARQGRTDFVGFLFSFGSQISPEDARRIYYRVTGVPFSELPRPRLKTGRGLFEMDFDQNGQMLWKLSADAGRAQLAEMAGRGG